MAILFCNFPHLDNTGKENLLVNGFTVLISFYNDANGYSVQISTSEKYKWFTGRDLRVVLEEMK